MSDSHRGIFIVAAVAAFFTLGVMGAGELRCQREYYSQSAYSVQGVGDEQQSTRFDRGWLPCLIEREAANPDASDASIKEQRDLIAQESMALWAFWMAFFSGLTALVTATGTALIWQQVRLTREAVTDTGKATEAMREANQIARDAQRPWIVIEDVSVSQIRFDTRADDGKPVFMLIGTCKLRNIGKTPAKNVCYHHMGYDSPFVREAREWWDGRKDLSLDKDFGLALSPGESSTQQICISGEVKTAHVGFAVGVHYSSGGSVEPQYRICRMWDVLKQAREGGGGEGWHPDNLPFGEPIVPEVSPGMTIEIT